MSTTARPRIDWPALRETLNLADVATRLLGPPPGRKGGGRSRWWRCPFHDDHNPSLCVASGKHAWKCYGCGEHGDAADLVMRVRRVGFPEAVAYLAGESAGAGADGTAGELDRPPGMPPAEALALVAVAESRLWTEEGVAALGYLHGRGLTDATIRAARLGYRPDPPGITIPWLAGAHDPLALLMVRQPDGVRPKYRELYRDRPTLYPGRHVIRPGRPLVIVEGELDTLLLGQQLGDLAAVVTLGSASARPVPAVLGAMLAATPWYAATDGDDAGDRAATGWPAPTRRVRPPGSCKDWTEVHQSGVDLRRWWVDRLALEPFLGRLQARGIRLDGTMVHPRIEVREATGRVVSTCPALQTLPPADRLARLGPVIEGHQFIRADYRQIEPRLMLAVLRRQHLIGWDAGEDLYADLAGDGSADRDADKTMVNSLVNGRRPEPGLTGRLGEFARAISTYREDLAADAARRGHVETLAGRQIPLDAGEERFEAKAVNRLIQGTAADIFHRAVVRIDEALRSRGLGAVAFLIYDEVWVECPPDYAAEITQWIRAEMTTAGLELGITLPVRIDPDPGRPPRYSWDQLGRWRWGPGLGDPEAGIVVA